MVHVCIYSFEQMIGQFIHVCNGLEFERYNTALVGEGTNMAKNSHVGIFSHWNSTDVSLSILLKKNTENRAIAEYAL